MALPRTTLGRTALEVSVAGLGCGGGALLGMRDGASAREAAKLVRLAFDLGVNLFDTAKLYGTEEAVGIGLEGLPRDQVVISTKHHADRRDGYKYTADDLVAGLEDSLTKLKTDYVDVLHVHGVHDGNVDHVVNVVLPTLRREQEKGKVRFVGATEYAQRDHEHAVMRRVVDADLVDVVMLAFSMLNQTARTSLFPSTLANNVGTLLMFVSRNLFGFPDRLKETLQELAGDDRVPAWIADAEEPLDFLLHGGGAVSLIDAAYRYARDEPGADVVLFGTGNADHLQANVESLSRPPLPDGDRARIDELFGTLIGVGIEPGESRGGKTAAA